MINFFTFYLFIFLTCFPLVTVMLPGYVSSLSYSHLVVFQWPHTAGVRLRACKRAGLRHAEDTCKMSEDGVYVTDSRTSMFQLSGAPFTLRIVRSQTAVILSTDSDLLAL